MMENGAQLVTHLGVGLVVKDKKQIEKPDEPSSDTRQQGVESHETPRPSEEIGGPSGPEPTRYGDWERKGRCIDF